MSRKLSGQRLAIARTQALQNLYQELDNKDGRFSFFTPEDTSNFKDSTEHLAKADLVSYDELCGLYDWLLAKAKTYFKKTGERLPIGIDCETTGLSPYKFDLIGIGLSLPIDTYDIFSRILSRTPIKEVQQITGLFTNYFLVAPTEEPEIKYFKTDVAWFLKGLNPYVKWHLHNAKFDMLWLLIKFGVMLEEIEDSIVMAYLLGESSIAIDKLAPKYLSRFPTTLQRMTGKDKKGLSPEVLRAVPIQEMADYCCEDCIEGILLSHVLSWKIKEEETCYGDLFDLYEDYDKYCIHALVWSEAKGVLIDWEKLSEVGANLEAELRAIEEDVALELDLTLKESQIVCSSAEKLSKVLYEDLGLPTEGIKKGVKGFYSTDKASLNKLAPLHPVPSALKQHRVLSKLKNTFVDGLESKQINGVLHTNYNNVEVDTGRYSSDNPNIQQIPNPAKSPTGKIIRQAFIARPGFCFVKADYSQFELRILAHFSQDPYLIDCYLKGLDVHSLVTCLLFDIPYEQFSPDTNPQHKKWRTLVKNINFGLIYGMTAFKLFAMSKDAGLDYTLEQCIELMNRYWSRLPGVRDWMAANRLFAIRFGYTETIFGRRRYFSFDNPYLKALKGKPIDLTYENWLTLEKKGVVQEFRDQESFRAIGNAPIQGSNADCIRRAHGLLYEEFKNTDATVLLIVHDEIVIECPLDMQCFVSDKLKHIMEFVASGLRVPVKADPSVALNWGDC